MRCERRRCLIKRSTLRVPSKYVVGANEGADQWGFDKRGRYRHPHGLFVILSLDLEVSCMQSGGRASQQSSRRRH